MQDYIKILEAIEDINETLYNVDDYNCEYCLTLTSDGFEAFIKFMGVRIWCTTEASVEDLSEEQVKHILWDGISDVLLRTDEISKAMAHAKGDYFD